MSARRSRLGTPLGLLSYKCCLEKKRSSHRTAPRLERPEPNAAAIIEVYAPIRSPRVSGAQRRTREGVGLTATPLPPAITLSRLGLPRRAMALLVRPIALAVVRLARHGLGHELRTGRQARPPPPRRSHRVPHAQMQLEYLRHQWPQLQPQPECVSCATRGLRLSQDL